MRPQGANWIRQGKRIAIYLRDRFRCAYCRRHASHPDVDWWLQLDHVTPLGREGASNDETNLVTCCNDCNQDKGYQTLAEYVRALLARGEDERRVRAMMMRVGQACLRPINLKRGKALNAARKAGSCAYACEVHHAR